MIITDIQRFCMHDGPGLRTTVFMKGCPLRCAWCHNPETQSPEPQMLYYEERCIHCGGCAAGDWAQCPTKAREWAGRNIEREEILETLRRDLPFYGEQGGLTLSGGEPMAQPEEALALLAACKAEGITTAIETCGYFDVRYLRDLAANADWILFDMKDTDPLRHQQYTGVSNQRILDNLLGLDRLGAKTLLRCILVAGVNTDAAHYHSLADLYKKLKNCRGIEFLPYHPLGNAKYRALTGKEPLQRDWVPSEAQLEEAKKIMVEKSVPVL